VIVAAYNALGYDALNLAYCDFRLGKQQTLALVGQAKFAVVSANLLDAQTNAPLTKPYCVVTRPDGKVAIVGVTERPAGLDILPHLRRQFAGIRIQPPVDALGQWLPKARAESDRVILLYYGSSSGLQAIQQKFGDQLAAIVVGGFRPEDPSPATAPPLVGARKVGGAPDAERDCAAGGRAVAGDAGPRGGSGHRADAGQIRARAGCDGVDASGCHPTLAADCRDGGFAADAIASPRLAATGKITFVRIVQGRFRRIASGSCIAAGSGNDATARCDGCSPARGPPAGGPAIASSF